MGVLPTCMLMHHVHPGACEEQNKAAYTQEISWEMNLGPLGFIQCLQLLSLLSRLSRPFGGRGITTGLLEMNPPQLSLT